MPAWQRHSGSSPGIKGIFDSELPAAEASVRRFPAVALGLGRTFAASRARTAMPLVGDVIVWPALL